MPTESVMPSNHLILCHPLLLLPSIFPSIRVLRPWDSPGKDTGVGGHALLQGNACAGCNEVRGTPGQWFGPPRTDGLEVRESCPEGTKENREHGTRGVGGLEAAAGGRMLIAPSSLCSCGPQASVFHKDTGVGCHALLQGIFPTQGSNPGLWHCRQILYH